MCCLSVFEKGPKTVLERRQQRHDSGRCANCHTICFLAFPDQVLSALVAPVGSTLDA